MATLTDSDQWTAKPGTVGKVTDNFEVFAADDDGLYEVASKADVAN